MVPRTVQHQFDNPADALAKENTDTDDLANPIISQLSLSKLKQLTKLSFFSQEPHSKQNINRYKYKTQKKTHF